MAITLESLALKLDGLTAKVDALLSAKMEPTMPEPVDVWASLDVDVLPAPYKTDDKLGNVSSLGTSYGPFSRSREIKRAWDGVAPDGRVLTSGDDLAARRRLVKALHDALNRKPDPNEAPKPVPAFVTFIVSAALGDGIDADVLYVALLWNAVGPHHFNGFQSLPVRLAGITLQQFWSTYLPGDVGSGGGPGIGTGDDKVGGTD